MKLKRLLLIIIATGCTAALLAWGHVQARSRKLAADRHGAPGDAAGLVLAGTIGPAASTSITGQRLVLLVPADSAVRRGDVIGVDEYPAAGGDLEQATQELEAARSALKAAEKNLRRAQDELGSRQTQADGLDEQEALAEAAGLDAQWEFERQDTLLREGLSSQLEYNQAAEARAAARTGIDSIHVNRSQASLDIDALEARAEAARAELRAETTRRDAAKAAVEQMHQAPHGGLIVAPVDGVVVYSTQPDSTTIGIASDPAQIVAHAMVRTDQVMDIRVGQEASIVPDKDPAKPFRGRVSAISETPVDLPDGAFYPVTFAAESPDGAWLSSGTMHAHLLYSSK